MYHQSLLAKVLFLYFVVVVVDTSLGVNVVLLSSSSSSSSSFRSIVRPIIRSFVHSFVHFVFDIYLISCLFNLPATISSLLQLLSLLSMLFILYLL